MWKKEMKNAPVTGFHVPRCTAAYRRRCLGTLMVACCLGTMTFAGSGPSPIMSRLHVISIHVRDYATFDGLFRFFRDTLQLPVLYGAPSVPEKSKGALYAGFSAGNSFFEPCGPYATDAPFEESRPARFHGLTFLVAESAAKSAIELDQRGLAHSGVKARALPGGEEGFPRFVHLTDSLLSGKMRSVSFWERAHGDIRVSPDRLQELLNSAHGGALGLQRVMEVELGYSRMQRLKQWDRLLSPASHAANSWSTGAGPSLHFLPGKEDDVRGVVLKVGSLPQARAFLEQKGLLGAASPDRLELAAEKAFGLRIVLIP